MPTGRDRAQKRLEEKRKKNAEADKTRKYKPRVTRQQYRAVMREQMKTLRARAKEQASEKPGGTATIR